MTSPGVLFEQFLPMFTNFESQIIQVNRLLDTSGDIAMV